MLRFIVDCTFHNLSFAGKIFSFRKLDVKLNRPKTIHELRNWIINLHSKLCILKTKKGRQRERISEQREQRLAYLVPFFLK